MSDEIIKLFWYSPEERELFPYIDAYMAALENWLDENQMDDKQLVRYMLVGLFLEYRAANHVGSNFDTTTETWMNIDWRPKTKQKFQILNKYLGRPIETDRGVLTAIAGSEYSRLHTALQESFRFRHLRRVLMAEGPYNTAPPCTPLFQEIKNAK